MQEGKIAWEHKKPEQLRSCQTCPYYDSPLRTNSGFHKRYHNSFSRCHSIDFILSCISESPSLPSSAMLMSHLPTQEHLGNSNYTPTIARAFIYTSD
jgi:hypothetical protein